MVVHPGWKYLGQGLSYVAYLVSGTVVKVPRSYIYYYNTQGGFDAAAERADFEIPPQNDYFGGDLRKRAIKVAKRQVNRARLYGDLAVPTSTDDAGLVYQPFVAGQQPSNEQERTFKRFLKEHRMPTTDMFSGNFRITPEGYRVFDF